MKLKTNAVSLIAIAATLNLAACAKNTPPAEAPVEPTAEPAPVEPAAAPPAELPPVSANTEEYYVDGVAGGVMVSTVELEAEVVSVDQEKREAVLRGPEGNAVTVRVGKDAVNFYQVKAGDRVNVTIARELTIYVPDEAPKTSEDGTTMMSASTEPGQSPARAVVASSKVTSKISALDTKARTATLTFEGGKKDTFTVRPDVDMKKYKVGQEVVFLLTEMLAMEVKKI